MIMKLFALCAIASLLLTATGCKHNPKLTLKHTPFELPQNWSRVENADEGIVVAAPAGWAAGDPNSIGPGDLMGGAADLGSNPNAQGFVSEMQKEDAEQTKKDLAALAAKGIYISVVDKQIKPIPGEARTHFQVQKYPQSGNASLDDAVAQMKDELNEDAPKAVDLPIGRAMMIRAVNDLKDGGIVTHLEYGLADGPNFYIVRFVTEEQPANAIEDIAPDVMKSLRIDKP